MLYMYLWIGIGEGEKKKKKEEELGYSMCEIEGGVVDSSISIIIGKYVELKKIRKMFVVCYFFLHNFLQKSSREKGK